MLPVQREVVQQGQEPQGHGYWVQGSGWAELHKSGDGYVVQVYNADSKHRGTISCPKY